MTPSEVIAFAKNKGARILDLRFMDFPGLWQHLSVPIGELNDAMFADGHGFDGSSIRGWQAINASDMLIIPDPNTAQIDPFLKILYEKRSNIVLESAARRRWTRRVVGFGRSGSGDDLSQ